MPLSTPSFWYKQRGILSALLTPVSWLYQLGHIINQTFKGTPYRSSIPVICIGNAVAGGSGKTPTVLSLTPLLKEHKISKNPFVLTRGYGANITEPTLVDFNKHTASDVGDEALLLAKKAPTIISPNRADGAKFAEENGADLIIMDDGLQNNHLHKTLSFLVIDRQIDFGNGKTIPAGPLREPLKKVLSKTAAVICIGNALHADKPVFESSIEPTTTLDLKIKYVAFAGLGLPDKFKNTLIDMDANLVGWHPFPDHHPYTDRDIKKLHAEATAKGATLITTEKDFVRLPMKLRENIQTLPIQLQFKKPSDLLTFISKKMKADS